MPSRTDYVINRHDKVHNRRTERRGHNCEAFGCTPVVVIDPEDRDQISAVIDELKKVQGQGPADVLDRWQMALRGYANPKPYREHVGTLSAPWPEVGECHSRHVEGHECAQCAWVHEHDWVAWMHPTGPEWPSNVIPIRCSKCGGRKCDLDLCDQQRHTHNHQDGA